MLKPQPTEEFDLAERFLCIVDSNRCVRAKSNRYSTPLRPGESTEVKLDASHVNVRCEGELAARHERNYSVNQEVLSLEHYLGVLEQKPGAFAHSKALVQYRQAGLWPVSFDDFWQKLMERKGRSEGTREMIGLLQLMERHGKQPVRFAVESALACGSGDAATVR